MKKNSPKKLLSFLKLKNFKPQIKLFISLAFFSFCFFFISTNCSSLKKKRNSDKAVSQIPVKDFFKNATHNNFKLSPNGKLLSYTKPYKNRMNVFVRATDQSSQKETRLTSRTKRDVRLIGWKGNNRVLFTSDQGGDENFHIYIIHLKNKKGKITPLSIKNLTPYKGVKAFVINLLSSIDPSNIFIAHNLRDRKVFDLYKFNLKTQKSTLHIKNDKNFTSYITDHNGKVRFATSTDGVNAVLYYRQNEEKKFTEIMRTNFKETFEPIFFTSDNKRIYALSNINRDKKALIEWDPESKKKIKTLFSHPTNDVWGAHWSKAKKKLTYVSFYTWKKNHYFFDSEYKGYFRNIENQLKGKNISRISFNQTESLFTFFASSDRDSGSYYFYDTKTKKLTFIVKPKPWFKESEMAKMKPISFKARDGLLIHGYLTLPIGNPKKKWPLVLLPHGGPWWRDRWGFNTEVQFLANRGYAVLQVNFRGSATYGKAFWQASFKEWGLKMQDDLTDGVYYVTKTKKYRIDKNKVCIYGASYGGYAVLAGLAFTPDIYQCGINYVGVSNLFTFIQSVPPYWKPYLDMFYKMIGHPKKDKELLRKASPLFHVDKIKSPLLVIHGANDPRVKQAESDQIVGALKKRGIDVPYILKKNEGHGFKNVENRIEVYEAIEKFLSKHLKTSY